MTVPKSSPDVGTVCTWLESEDRRQTLDLLARNGEMTLGELAQGLCVGGEKRDREQLKIRLHHVHLPKLADDEVIDYDPENKVVSMTGEGHRLHSSLGGLEWVREVAP